MKKYNHKLVYLFILLTLALFSSCLDEDDFDLDRLTSPTVHPSFEANLLTMDFTAMDFFNQIADSSEGVEILIRDDSLILSLSKDFVIDGEELTHDYFNKDVKIDILDFDLSDISVPDWYEETFSDDFTVIYNQRITVNVPEFEKYEQTENNRIIDSVVLSSGTLLLDVVSSLPYDAEIHLKADSIINTKTRQPLNEILTVKANQQSQPSIDLTDYMMKFVGYDDYTSSFDIVYSVVLKTKGRQVVSGDFPCNIKMSAENLNIDLAFGMVGNPDILTEDVLEVNFFADSTIKSDMVNIKEINMNFDITNYTGIRLFIDLNKLRTRTRTGYIQNMFYNDTTLTVEPAANPQTTALTHLVVNMNPQSVTKLPNQFLYDIRSVFGDGHQKGFIRPNGKYADIHSVITIPFIVSVNDFVTEQQTGALDFLQDDGGVGDYVDSAILKVYLENTFPAELKIDIDLMDEAGQRSPLLNESILAEAATVNSEGRVTAPSDQKQTVTITQEQYNRLRNADKIIFRAAFNTSKDSKGNKPLVFFSKDAALKLKLGIKAALNITIE